MRRIRNNSLSLVMFGLFLLTLCGQTFAGQREYNQEQKDHRQPEATLSKYVTSGHFVEGVFENWESEFLQMGAYVLLTVWLRQRGSPESKKLDEPQPEDEDPAEHANDPDAPWAVRAGGPVRRIYSHSLSLALFTLFFLSWFLHALGGAREYSEEQEAHGGKPVTTAEFVRTSTFWFQSMQNWQSEFMAVGSLVVLSIVLRQEGSPESKAVADPHSKTGT